MDSTKLRYEKLARDTTRTEEFRDCAQKVVQLLNDRWFTTFNKTKVHTVARKFDLRHISEMDETSADDDKVPKVAFKEYVYPVAKGVVIEQLAQHDPHIDEEVERVYREFVNGNNGVHPVVAAGTLEGGNEDRTRGWFSKNEIERLATLTTNEVVRRIVFRLANITVEYFALCRVPQATAPWAKLNMRPNSSALEAWDRAKRK
jgi:hypothetical protein